MIKPREAKKLHAGLIDLLLLPFPEGFSQFRFEDLTCARQWHRFVPKADALWTFEAGYMLVAVLDDRWLIHSFSIAQPDDGVHYLAPFSVRDTDGHGFYNSRNLVQDIFHLSRIDVLTTGDNDVLRAILELDIAIWINDSQVAGMEPAAGQ